MVVPCTTMLKWVGMDLNLAMVLKYPSPGLLCLLKDNSYLFLMGIPGLVPIVLYNLLVLRRHHLDYKYDLL